MMPLRLTTLPLATLPLAALTLVIASPSFAQTDPTAVPQVVAGPSDLQPRLDNRKQVYQASQFARFAPKNALEMVMEIPGFSITAVSSDRGLGEASQNVLINGQRITGKSNDAATALRRISVSSVIQLEIADGSSFGVSGINGQVLNVVTKAGGVEGNYSWRGQIRSRIDPLYTNGEVNISGKLGQGDFTLGLNNTGAYRAGGWGTNTTSDAKGKLLVTRDFFNSYGEDTPKLNGTYSLKGESGSIFNANAAIGIQRFKSEAFYDVSGANRPSSTEYSTSTEEGWNFEGGGDYEFGLGRGRVKLVGLHRATHTPATDLFRVDDLNGAALSGERYDQTSDDGETVARAEYQWKAGKSDWEISLESAFNFLDTKASLFELNGGNYVQVPLQGASARVEERRTQILVNFSRPLSSTLTLQASLGGEASELSQTGSGTDASSLTRSFVRPKGSLALNWAPHSSLTVSSKLQRKVGQLSFSSFLASVDLQDGIDNGANPALVPPQSWLWENEANWSLGKMGSVKFKLDGEAISDLVDQIAISPSVEAVGNLPGTATRWRGEINGTFALETIGFVGAKLDILVALQDTKVRDALLITRPISNRGLSAWSISLRHDVPGTQVAWGFLAENNVSTPFYRLDYQSKEVSTDATTSIYVEHKDIFGFRIRTTVQNVLNQKEKEREVFYVDRRNGPVARIRNSGVEWGPVFRLAVWGTF